MDANPTLCKMLGYTKDELMQKSWKEITHPSDMPANMEKFNRALNGEIDNYSLEKRFIRKDGSSHPCRYGCSLPASSRPHHRLFDVIIP